MTGTKPTDADLIDATLAGRDEAFGVLFRRYGARLHNGLAKALGSPEEAADVTQEAFLKAFRKLNTFRGASGFYTWLYRIALNTAASRRRSAARRPLRFGLGQGGGLSHDPTDTADGPAGVAEAAERTALVRAALNSLPEDYRTAMVLREIEGFSYEQIAAVLGVPVGTVRSRLHRGRGELRERLAPLLRECEPKAAPSVPVPV